MIMHTSAARIRVAIADDHPIILEGLLAKLAVSNQISVVGTANTYAALLELLKSHIADVVILDLQGMKASPLMMVNHLRRAYPQIAIVIFSSLIDVAPELFKAGVHGYVTKIEMTSHLQAAIEAVTQGNSFVSPMVAQYLQREQGAPQYTQLTTSEKKVLKLLANGHGTIEIGELLGIDARSVQNYITTLRRKTGCMQRTQLVDWYRMLFPEGL
jgi:DNA-binding NarL/FixJ family response regulator